MKNLQIDESKARELYPTASKEFKAMLEDSFGKNFFVTRIQDRIKSFEDACEDQGENPRNKKFTEGTKDDIAYQKIKVIIKALNQGWAPNWGNDNEKKWYAYFKYSASGFGFSHTYCEYWHTGTNCGSRLCLISSELAEYCGGQFIEIWNDFLN